MLAKNGADKNSRDKDGMTCFIRNCINQNYFVLNFLLKQGVDKDAQDKKGRTAYIHACIKKNL